ncbi:MAG: hypothetical protein JW819_00875 [Candidatus Krumholzibacteriota bacterium]|nr:hypothetical protein [Candidatus Krumholzibacteriota bacterium]
MRWNRAPLLTIALAVLAAVLAGGCLFSPPEKDQGGGGTTVTYHAYTAPESLALNFVKCWEARDIAEYRDQILYDGILEATDGEVYAAFTFYPVEGEYDPNTGEPLQPYLYEQEWQAVQRLFAGNDGWDGENVIPGVRSIEAVLSPGGADWATPPTSDVEGDAFPDGTQWKRYSTSVLFTLKGTIPGTEINGFNVVDALDFYVIPVTVGEGDDAHTEYRIWKWRDIDVR